MDKNSFSGQFLNNKKFELKKLKFNFDELEPYISTYSLKEHYNHYIKYINDLNTFIKNSNLTFNNSVSNSVSLYDVVKKAYKVDADDGFWVNGSQALNHLFFWECLKPYNEKKQLTPFFTKLLQNTYSETESENKIDNFYNEIIKKSEFYGNGWICVYQQNDILVIKVKKNTSSIFDFDDESESSNLLLTIDCWEHAYYLQFLNNKKKYLNNIFKLLDYNFIESNINIDCF